MNDLKNKIPHFSVLRVLIVGFIIYSALSSISIGFTIFKKFPLMMIEQKPQKVKELIQYHNEMEQKIKELKKSDDTLARHLEQELGEKMEDFFNPYKNLEPVAEFYKETLDTFFSITMLSIVILFHFPLYKFFYYKRKNRHIPQDLRKKCKSRLLYSPLVTGTVLPFTIIAGIILEYLFLAFGLNDGFKTMLTLTLLLKIDAAIFAGVLMFSWQKYRVQNYFLTHVFFPEELRSRLPALQDMKLKLRIWSVSLVTIILPILIVAILISTSLSIHKKPASLNTPQLELLLGEYIIAAEQLDLKSELINWLNKEGFKEIDEIVYINAINTPILILGLIICILSILIYSIVLMHFFITNITRPLNELRLRMQETMKGNYKSFVVVRNNDEVGELAEGYNKMLTGLEEREKLKGLFGQYLTREVSEEILNGRVKMGGDYFDATVMFSDIRGFTAMSEKMKPEEVLSFLNTYLEKMIEVIVKHGGIIDKFMGDGILAIFGVPLRTDSHSGQAFLAAMDMKNALKELNKTREESGLLPIRIGIGLHSGQVIAGNIGNSHKTEYTIIGDTVNLASRIEGLTKVYNTSLLISDSTFSLLPDEMKENLSMESIPDVIVRGKSETVQLYKLNEDIAEKN